MGREKGNSAVIECRVDIRTLAELATFYKERDQTLHSRSELGRQICEDLRGVLMANNLIKEIEFTDEALSVMVKLGYGNCNRSGRGRHSLEEALSRELELPESVTKIKHLNKRLEEALNAMEDR